MMQICDKVVGHIWRKPVLTYASSVCGTAGVGEYGELSVVVSN